MSRKSLLGLLITLGVFLVVVLMSACSPATEPEPVPVPEPVVSTPEPVTLTPEPEPVPVPEPVEEPIIVEPPEETQSMPSTGGLIELELILFGLGATSLGTGLAIMRKRKK